MENKTCTRCEELKPLCDFHTRKNGKPYPYCKDCHKKYVKAHYESNKDYYKAKARNRSKEIQEWLNDYKSKLKCSQCDEKHPACLEFHHEFDKELEISKVAANGWTQERIMKEIAKCIVLCSNCHKKLHWNEKSGPWVWRN